MFSGIEFLVHPNYLSDHVVVSKEGTILNQCKKLEMNEMKFNLTLWNLQECW